MVHLFLEVASGRAERRALAAARDPGHDRPPSRFTPPYSGLYGVCDCKRGGGRISSSQTTTLEIQATTAPLTGHATRSGQGVEVEDGEVWQGRNAGPIRFAHLGLTCRDFSRAGNPFNTEICTGMLQMDEMASSI